MSRRGIFQKVPGSGEWWIRYADTLGRIRREKAGTWASARDLYIKRKAEVLQGRKLPEELRHVPLRTVAELLGHKTLTMTMRYAHLAPAHLRDAVECLTGQNSTATTTDTELLWGENFSSIRNK